MHTSASSARARLLGLSDPHEPANPDHFVGRGVRNPAHIANGFFLDGAQTRPAAPVAQPAPQPPRAHVARPAPAPAPAAAPSKGSAPALIAASRSVYIWEDVGRKHNGVQIYKIGVANTHCPDGTCGVKRRMNEVARACAATPKLIHHAPVHNAKDVEEQLLRNGVGDVPGNTDGKTEFRTMTRAQLAKCISDMELHRATGLAPPPPPKPLGIKAIHELRAKEIRKDFRASHGGLSGRQWHMLQSDRRALYNRLASQYLQSVYKYGWLKPFKYIPNRATLPADVEADIQAQVDAKYPLPSRGA